MIALRPLGPWFNLIKRPMPKAGTEAPLFVFASYMVGDLFMALPALKALAAARPVRILCRPDCVSLLHDEGLRAVAFENAFLTDRTPSGFRRTVRAARALRQHPEAALASTAFDLDASPLSALWLRLAGFPHVISYRRDYGALFTETFALPAGAVHQADRDVAVVEYILNVDSGRWMEDGGKTDVLPATDYRLPTTDISSSPWLLSVWTRKPSKNWPLAQWDQFLEEVLHQGVVCAVLLAPDGDADYRAFRARWEARVPFVGGGLPEVAAQVKRAAGVIATDNFLGHMAGYYDKPVLWINRSSPAAQVRPRGPHTLEVAPHGASADEPQALEVDVVVRAFAALRGV
jgi:ADP-heptose:LPS heptosyltransferase